MHQLASLGGALSFGGVDAGLSYPWWWDPVVDSAVTVGTGKCAQTGGRDDMGARDTIAARVRSDLLGYTAALGSTASKTLTDGSWAISTASCPVSRVTALNMAVQHF